MSEGSTPLLEVVTVPDFEGHHRERFEARTLLFLACWLEFGRSARSFPLHLCCIGEPPASVRWLAARCEARVHVRAPLATGGWRGINKLRGFEVEIRADRRLLLDSDVLVLSDFSDVGTLGCTLAASPAVKARVPDRLWDTIYTALGVPAPTTRLASLVGRLDAGDPERPAYPEQRAESRAMRPYYNGGVLLVPRDTDLRPRWEGYIEQIAGLLGSGIEARRALAASDQAGLAVAIVALGHQGMPVACLPDRLHGTWLHLYRRAPPLEHISLFHAFGLFGRTHRMDRSLSFHIDHYCYQVARRLATAWRHDPRGPLRPSTFGRYLGPALLDVWRLRRQLHLVYRKHVQPALAAGAR